MHTRTGTLRRDNIYEPLAAEHCAHAHRDSQAGLYEPLDVGRSERGGEIEMLSCPAHKAHFY